MKNIAFIFAVLMMITSCGLLSKKEVIRNEVYRDSITIRNQVIVDTLKISADTLSGKVNLELLKQIGSLTFRGDRTTTKLYYQDGNIGFTTMSDSLYRLIISRIDEVIRESRSEIDRESTEIKKEPKQTPVLNKLIAFAIILLLLAIIIYIIILNSKNAKNDTRI